jgi:ubiquinol oxidase
METVKTYQQRHEELVQALFETETFESYRANEAHIKIGALPRFLGKVLVTTGNLFYGSKPSYAKFKALEIVARIPYQSWEVATYILLTLFFADEQRAIRLSKVSYFTRVAQDNETMHVVLMSGLAKKYDQDTFWMHTFVPVVFSFVYFLCIFVLFLMHRKSAFELNYCFESHAFDQYQCFLDMEGARLKFAPVQSEFLEFYGRHVKNEYELFVSIRNDELIHRNQSVTERNRKLISK